MDFRIELIPLAGRTSTGRTSTATGSDGTSTSTGRSPPGCASSRSCCPDRPASICFGIGLEMLPSGSSQFIQVVVEDADAALAYLRERDVECEGVDEQPWGRFVYFTDPDGNRWAFQQLPIPS